MNREQSLLSVDAFAMGSLMTVFVVNAWDVSVATCQRSVLVPMHMRFSPIPQGVMRMPVLVNRWIMGVHMLMPLQQMQAHAQCHHKWRWHAQHRYSRRHGRAAHC